MIDVVLNDEGRALYCTDTQPSKSGCQFAAETRQENSTTELPRLVKPNRSQRVYFDGGSGPSCNGSESRIGGDEAGKPASTTTRRATFEVDSRPFMVVRAGFDGRTGPRACVRWRRPLKSKGLGSIRQRTFGQHQVGTSFKASSNGRCFLQFDRKTDCFDAWVAAIRQYLPSPMAESRDMLGPGSSPRFKAVCGTQTRPKDSYALTYGAFRQC